MLCYSHSHSHGAFLSIPVEQEVSTDDCRGGVPDNLDSNVGQDLTISITVTS